jgi:hypothetical protein
MSNNGSEPYGPKTRTTRKLHLYRINQLGAQTVIVVNDAPNTHSPPVDSTVSGASLNGDWCLLLQTLMGM